MHSRSPRPWPTYLLAALCVGAIVAAVLLVGPASGTQPATGRTITVGQGVVQSTVSGSGNIQAATQLDLGFKTSGVVTQIYVSQGAHVTEGQLLAELNPESAEVTLEQAKASLQAAEADLVQEEETDGESSSGSGSSGSGSTGSDRTTASTASVDREDVSRAPAAAPVDREAVSYSPSTVPGATAPTASSTPTTTTPAPTTTAPTPTTTTAAPTPTTSPRPTTTAPAHTAPSSTTTHSHAKHTKSRSETTLSESGSGVTGSGSSSAGGERESSSSPTSKATLSTAAREANIASARAAVKSDRLTVQSAEEALSDTKLFAPADGTIVSLSGEVGEAVSASGTTKSSTSSSSSSGSGSASAGSALGGASAAGGSSSSGSGSSGSGSSGSGSSSSSFAVLSDLTSMQLVVPLSESEVIDVRPSQPATVTIEALEGLKLAAHVSSVATLPTSTSGVVSYDVTFQLDQLESGLKPGMSATAEVVVKQAEGVNVPTSAISADTVTVVHDGKQTRRRVVTGLAGDSSTIILSGLSAGEEILLPVARASTTSSLSSRLGSRAGALGGAAGALGGGGGAAFFGGGGGGFRGG